MEGLTTLNYVDKGESLMTRVISGFRNYFVKEPLINLCLSDGLIVLSDNHYLRAE